MVLLTPHVVIMIIILESLSLSLSVVLYGVIIDVIFPQFCWAIDTSTAKFSHVTFSFQLQQKFWTDLFYIKIMNTSSFSL